MKAKIFAFFMNFFVRKSEKEIKKFIYDFVTKAEKNGWTHGIDLPEQQIADFLFAILSGIELSPKEKIKAAKMRDLLGNAIFNFPTP